MPTCERLRQRGFTYLLLLFSLVLGGIALAAIGQQWQVTLQREREAELLFRGGEIRKAIDSFHGTAAGGVARYPASLAELVVDARQPEPRYHLRRLYPDPFTGAVDWLTLRDAEGGIVGVRSRSRRLALARHKLPVGIALPAGAPVDTPVRVGDWVFGASGVSPAQP